MLLGPLFEPWAVLGPKWSPSLPREPPGWSPTLFLMIFDGFWTHFLLILAFPHLSATTVFSVHFFQKPKAHTRDVKWEPKMSLITMSSGRESETNYNKIGNWKPWTLEDHGFSFERLLKTNMSSLFQKPHHKYSKLCSTFTKMYQILPWKHYRQDNKKKSKHTQIVLKNISQG